MKTGRRGRINNYTRRYAVLIALIVVLGVAYIGSRSYSLVENDESLVENDPSPSSTPNVDGSTNPTEQTNNVQTEPPKPATALPLYVPVSSTVNNQISEWLQDPARRTDVETLQVLATTPTAVWLSGPDADNTTRIREHIDAAIASATTPVFVFYNIPQLGCSSGGATNLANYTAWIDQIMAQTSRLDKYIAIIEPDAVPMISCLDTQQKNERRASLKYAVESVVAQGGYAYLDAGHSNWVSANDVAATIRELKISTGFGLSVNVSNYGSTPDSVAYGNQLSKLLGNTPFIVDTSRNGLGPDANNEWCNAPGRAIGQSSRIINEGNLTGYMWIKVPGESDGPCNGGPAEGQWWAEYALNLVRNSQ